jgi:hypothetical protein
MWLIAPEAFTVFIRRESIYSVCMLVHNDAQFIPFILLFMLFVDKSTINSLDCHFLKKVFLKFKVPVQNKK